MQMGLQPWSWMHWIISRSSRAASNGEVTMWVIDFMLVEKKICQTIYSTNDMWIFHTGYHPLNNQCKVANHLGCNIKCENYSIEGTAHLPTWMVSSMDHPTTNKHGTMWFNTPNGLIGWTRASDGLIVAIKRALDHAMVHRKAIFLMASVVVGLYIYIWDPTTYLQLLEHPKAIEKKTII
jgi:hypothetical protein